MRKTANLWTTPALPTTLQAGGGNIMVLGMFSWLCKGPLIYVEQYLNVKSGSTDQGGNWPSQETFSRSTFLPVFSQFLFLKTRRSFSRPSIHLRFGLPFLRVPIG
ncbi:hypothetical protein TNCV_4421111 [Trichonephila clavipes]|nr:hypothetical protein TNCV_4421111 [Trichonephila clavipes]